MEKDKEKPVVLQVLPEMNQGGVELGTIEIASELTLSMPLNLRDDLDNGNVLTVHGILDRSVTNKGLIQIVLKVTEVEKIKELAVSEDEIKRTELRRIKSEKGFKNVDSLLESLLYQDKRPQIALIYAETSITNDDFEKGDRKSVV